MKKDAAHPNTARLTQLIEQYKLSSLDIAAMTGRKVATVRLWRMANTERVIPDALLFMVEVKAPHLASLKVPD